MAYQYTHAKINQITNECCDSIEEMLDKLQVTYIRSSRRFFGPCPIHGGDNPAAWNLYPEGDNVRGIWFCRTHNCHEKWKKTLVGFVHGLMSSRTEKEIKWTKAVDWMVDFLGYKNIGEVRVPDAAALERQHFNNVTRKLNVTPLTQTEKTWQPDSYRRAVDIPSQYYIDRGYKKETLLRYDVGHATRTNRSVVPVYDNEHKLIVGMTARTEWNKCPECQYYHDEKEDCPRGVANQINACKWKNSPSFEAAHFLYNLWFARPYIIESSSIIIVEGPGDVWRLEEAGIKNSVAIFGTELSDEQQALLESSWAMNIVVLTDNDEAGKKAALAIKKKMTRTHRLYFPNLVANDVGDLQTDQVTSDIEPVLNCIMKFNREVGVR